MRAVLKGGPWCTNAIREYYDCSSIDQRLKNLLLARSAFSVDANGDADVWVSAASLSELNALETRLCRATGAVVNAKPPRFAIADGFVAGSYPEIDDATCIELPAVALAQVRGVVKVVYSGPGNMLNSHLLCWDNRDATIASRVPSIVTRDRFQLILAGPMTPAQDIVLAKRHECSGDRVRRVHDLLSRINPMYAGVAVDGTCLARSSEPASITTRLSDGQDTGLLVASARARQSTVARAPDTGGEDERRECTVVESETVLLETTADRNEQTRLARAFANVTSTSATYVVRRSTTILPWDDLNYMERMFPHLLTFGIGGFKAGHLHRYSPRSVVLHYLNVASNRFAEDSMFKLVMFDHLATLRVESGVFLRVGRDPSLATTAMRVTPAEFKDAMRRRVKQRAAWKSGRQAAPPSETPQTSTLLKSINAATSKMWGSNEEREAVSRKVDSMTTRYGAPSVFWTLTPNPDSSLVFAFCTGRELPGGRPETLTQCGELNTPCSSEMTRLIMRNTVVQAQYYKLCCNILIDVLFGWDMKANKPKSQRGIFGFVEAFVYALEQQGRLFVHHHGVAWVAGLSDWERVLASNELRTRFERYCASIFAAELPVYNSIDVVDCQLDGCRERLDPSPIPKKFKHVLRSSVPAPVVAVCDACDEGFSVSAIIHTIISGKSWTMRTKM